MRTLVGGFDPHEGFVTTIAVVEVAATGVCSFMGSATPISITLTTSCPARTFRMLRSDALLSVAFAWSFHPLQRDTPDVAALS